MLVEWAAVSVYLRNYMELLFNTVYTQSQLSLNAVQFVHWVHKYRTFVRTRCLSEAIALCKDRHQEAAQKICGNSFRPQNAFDAGSETLVEWRFLN